MPSQLITPEAVRHGWHDDPKEVEAVVSRMRYPVAGLAMSREFLATEHRDVMLWQYEEKFLGKALPAARQTVGDCVSQAWARAVRYLMLRNLVAMEMSPTLFVDIATEPIYALSRIEVGKGRIRGDGSVGAWAAESVQAPYGVLQRKAYGSFDLSTYSGQRARQWGGSREGLPAELERIARDYPVSMAPLVVTDDELKGALYNEYAVPICSGQGFTETRDKYGFCDPRGSWAHCMACIGILLARRAGRDILAGAIAQSWGNSPGGNDKVTLATGEEIRLPQGVFLVELDIIVKRMLRQRDSFAPAGPNGFVPALSLAL